MRLPGGSIWPTDYEPQYRDAADGARQYRYGRGRWRDCVPAHDGVRQIVPRDDHPVMRAWQEIARHVDLRDPGDRHTVLSWLALAAPVDDHDVCRVVMRAITEIVNEINRMQADGDIMSAIRDLSRRLADLERVVHDDARLERDARGQQAPTVEAT